MGITGLLPLLRGATRRISLNELAGETVAVDAYSWLHRGIYGACAVDLFYGRTNESYIDYCLSKVDQLLKHNVRPLLVFDGGTLPIKSHRETQRALTRKESREKVARLTSEGKTSEAHMQIQKSCDVTPFMASRLIEALRKRSIEYVVAPYEADAQMAWLERNGKCTAIITEDSDLLLFGCRRVLFKLDSTGWADEVRLDRFLGYLDSYCPEIQLSKIDLTGSSGVKFFSAQGKKSNFKSGNQSKVISNQFSSFTGGNSTVNIEDSNSQFNIQANNQSASQPSNQLCLNLGSQSDFDLRSFNLEQFRHICILSGCDYLASVPGVGLKTAYRLMKKNDGCIDRVLSQMRREMAAKMIPTYLSDFAKADLTFQYQRIFDTDRRRVALLNPLPETMNPTEDSLDFLGKHIPDAIAEGISVGSLCPISYLPIEESQNIYSKAKDIKVDKCLADSTSKKRPLDFVSKNHFARDKKLIDKSVSGLTFTQAGLKRTCDEKIEMIRSFGAELPFSLITKAVEERKFKEISCKKSANIRLTSKRPFLSKVVPNNSKKSVVSSIILNVEDDKENSVDLIVLDSCHSDA